MLFAIDFDGTFARDPDLFREWVVLGRRMGHAFVMVTGRSDEGQWGREVRDAVGKLMPIVFAADGWKRAAAERAGFVVDVWIDDHPEYIAAQDLAKVAKRDGYTAEGLTEEERREGYIFGKQTGIGYAAGCEAIAETKARRAGTAP